MTEIRSRDGIWVYFSVAVVVGAAETARALQRLYGRYGDCTGATETARALRGLYGRYEDYTGAPETVRALQGLYG